MQSSLDLLAETSLITLPRPFLTTCIVLAKVSNCIFSPITSTLLQVDCDPDSFRHFYGQQTDFLQYMYKDNDT